MRPLSCWAATRAAIVRFAATGPRRLIGGHNAADGPGGIPFTPDPDYVVAAVTDRTRRALRHRRSFGSGYARAVRAEGIRSGLASPIVVDGALWGTITVASLRPPLPSHTERRLADFTELVGTAISNAQSREAHQALADEQAALRRVATLVAREGPPAEVFESRRARWRIFSEMPTARCTGTRVTARRPSSASRGQLCRPQRIGHAMANRRHRRHRHGAARGPAAPDRRLRRGSHRDDRDGGKGPHRGSRSCRLSDRRGRAHLGSDRRREYRPEAFPADTEAALTRFADLAATAVANAEARAEIERLAEEQTALRRVATLVAKGVEPAELFSAVTQEVAALFSTVTPPFTVTVIRFDPGPEFVLAGASSATDPPIGARWRPTDFYVSTRVHRTGGSARVDAADLQIGSPEADTLRSPGLPLSSGQPDRRGGSPLGGDDHQLRRAAATGRRSAA